jgi:hypothetical protein
MKAEFGQRAAVQDASGNFVDGYLITVVMTEVEANDLLSRYDPASGTSPGVADARPVARVILNEIIEIQAGPVVA